MFLICEGRKPTTKKIGLENVGVELDKVGAIKVCTSIIGVVQLVVMCAIALSQRRIYHLNTVNGSREFMLTFAL